MRIAEICDLTDLDRNSFKTLRHMDRLPFDSPGTDDDQHWIDYSIAHAVLLRAQLNLHADGGVSMAEAADTVELGFAMWQLQCGEADPVRACLAALDSRNQDGGNQDIYFCCEVNFPGGRSHYAGGLSGIIKFSDAALARRRAGGAAVQRERMIFGNFTAAARTIFKRAAALGIPVTANQRKERPS